MKGAPPTKTMILDEMDDIIKTVDAHAREINKKWGFNRLPHIVPIDLAVKFKSQKRKWELACFECTASLVPAEIKRVKQHGEAMLRAYAALEKAALAEGHTPSPPGVWGFELANGTPIVLVRTRDEMNLVEREEGAQVWCLEEIAEILTKYPELAAVKDTFPDAELIQMRTSTETREALADALDDEIPFV